jgi:hypothetical protein
VKFARLHSITLDALLLPLGCCSALLSLLTFFFGSLVSSLSTGDDGDDDEPV